MDCFMLPFLFCASCCCHSWVAKQKREVREPASLELVTSRAAQ